MSGEPYPPADMDQLIRRFPNADGSYRFSALSNVDYEVNAEYNGARRDTKTLSGFDTRARANVTLRVK